LRDRDVSRKSRRISRRSQAQRLIDRSVDRKSGQSIPARDHLRRLTVSNFDRSDFLEKEALQFEQIRMVRTQVRVLLDTPDDVAQHLVV
jgi:hypothetical protein